MPTLKKISKKKKSKKKQQINFLKKFVNKKMKNENLVIIDKNNRHNLDYQNKDVSSFLHKLVDILNFSFEKEREYHISQGSYYPGYKHDINTIKSNMDNDKYITYVLTTKSMIPISMLYVERNEDDYDKIWTVCTDNKFRGRGMSSKLLDIMIKKQLAEKRKKMLLEVFEDDVLNRQENDVKQSQIMGLFSSKGFQHINHNNLDQHTFNNLLYNDGKTKIMVFKPIRWMLKNDI